MTRTFKTLLSLLLAVSLLLGALPFTVAAAGAEERSSMLQTEEGVRDQILSDEPVFAAQTSSALDMYSQLTKRQKACYDAIGKVTVDQMMTSGTKTGSGDRVYYEMELNIPGIVGQTMSGTVRNGKLELNAASAATETNIYTDICAAIVALRCDHPEYLWMRSMNYGYYSVREGNTKRVTSVIASFRLQWEGREKAMNETLMANARAVANQAASQPDTYSKLRAVQEYLMENNTYGALDDSGNAIDPLAHTPYSALVVDDGHDPVCDGYSKAFKVICGFLEIPCFSPISEGHMWNNVQMDDGLWYNVDVTWDDDDNEPAYNYFLVGSQTVVDGEPFCREESHIEVDPFLDSIGPDSSLNYSAVSLRFPVKSETAYEYLGHDRPQPTFRDVPRDSYCYDAVEWAVAGSVTTGTSASTFTPGQSCTRAQAVTFLWRAAGSPAPVNTQMPFTDVGNDYYRDAVLWAVENGITTGTSATTFSPARTCSRGQIVSFLWRFAQSPEVEGGNMPFTDVKEDSYYRTAVQWAVENDITTGVSATAFAPEQNCNRGQIVTFLYRHLGE